MLYKNLLIIPYVLNTLNSPTSVQATTQTIKASKKEYHCTGGSTDECYIYCDEGESDETRTFSCGNVGECYFHCDEKKCISSGTLDATTAHNLYVIVSGHECMKHGTVYTPSNGNATFTMTEAKGFKEISIESGANTQNIIINCDADISDSKDDCKTMNIDAATANYLEINVANSLEFESSTVKCPINSDYKGPNEASCIIDATNGGVIKDVSVETQRGIPADLWIRDNGAESITDLTVSCDYGSFTWPWIGDECWNTVDPTVNPTVNPTFNPTINPTFTPTFTPTFNPSLSEPSVSPTKTPTKQPTTPAPILSVGEQTPSPTDNEESVVEETVVYIGRTTAQQSVLKDKSVDVSIILISIGVLLVVVCICLFLCYWYRKEKYYKEVLNDHERSVILSKPLMPGTAIGEQSIEMNLFENNPYNKLKIPNDTHQMAQYSLNSNDSYGSMQYKVTDSGLGVPQKSHGESISLMDGESMDVEDLEIVDEVNRQHTEGEVNEGIHTNETCDDDDIDDIDAFDDGNSIEHSKQSTQGFIE